MEEEIEGIRVIRTPDVLSGFITETGFRDVSEVFAFTRWAFDRLNSDRLPDVIEANHCPIFPALGSWLAKTARGRSLCVTFHECWHDHWHNYVPNRAYAPLGMILEKVTTWVPDVAVSVSELTARRLVACLGMRSDTIFVIPNGVDLERVRKAEVDRNSHEIVYVGRLNSHKKVDWLIEAFARLKKGIPDAKLTIAGDGPEGPSYRFLAARIGVSDVEFTGTIEDDEVFALLRRAGVYVLPSIREGQSITTLEAMAAGTPQVVVEADGNGAADLVRSGVTGIVTEPNSGAIADGVTKIMSDDELWLRLHKNSLSFVRRYTWDAASAQYLQVYNDLLSS